MPNKFIYYSFSVFHGKLASANSINTFFEESLRDFLEHQSSENAYLHLDFFDVEFPEAIDFNLHKILKNMYDKYSNLKVATEGKLSISFDRAIFENYPNFDNVQCHKLSFSNTVFKKGARFRHIDVDDVLFEPRELSADATFFHREKADIDTGVLRGKEIGKIGRFKYRHQLEGDGTTFLIGMRFTERAEFTDCVLDKVQFSFIDEGSMSKCFFANSMIEDTKFYNCSFPLKPNLPSVLDKRMWFGSPLWFVIKFVAIVLLVYLDDEILKIFDVNNVVIFLFFCFAFIFLMPLFFGLFNLIFMLVMFFMQKIVSSVTSNDMKVNHHVATGDDDKIPSLVHDIAILNSKTVREVYRQLKVNFEQHGDYQTAGDFYYSQRYCEMIGFSDAHGKQLSQISLISLQHWINGFGERWFRALIWFLVTLLGFAFFVYEPNKDFISTKSTPEYFLHANINDDKGDKNHTCKIYFDRCSVTNDLNKSADFMLIAKTSFDDDNVTFNAFGKDFVYEPNSTVKKIFAYDNRFDYQYSEQYIPMLKNNDGVLVAHSLSKMIAPFVSEEKKWFQDRSERAYYLGFLETILLWIFFLAFVFAVKNRIRR